MNYSVVKGTSYILVHAPDMIFHNGTTATTERYLHPDSEYLKAIPNHIRSYEKAVNYIPNQVYIGNNKPEELKNYEQPWFDKDVTSATKDFIDTVKPKLEAHPLISDELVAKLKGGDDLADIEKLVAEQGAEALYMNNKVVGCVKKGHDVDVNLNAHVLLENLVSKASGTLAALHLLDKNGLNAEEIDYG